MRKPIIVGNWKMNKTAKEAREFMEELTEKAPKNEDIDLAIAPPVLFIQDLVNIAQDSSIEIGAQNAFYENEGAYTGETSPHALAELDVEYVIIGHSERREIFEESDEEINKKAHAVLEEGMVPIICVGESEAEREAGETQAVVENQIENALANLEASDVEALVLAYEPIWAIGTGKTATPEEANERIGLIREKVAGLYSKEVADSVRIQYGGSVKPDNIKEFMEQPHIDGALVGGASLDVDSFLALAAGTDIDE